MTSPAVQFIKKGRNRLNRILSAYYYLESVFIASLILGLLLIILRFTFILWVDVTLFIFVSLILGIIGLVPAWRKRLDMKMSAAWLDGRLSSKEALTALLNDERNGIFDTEIAGRAADVIQDGKIAWPFRKLKISALKSFLSLLIIGLLMAYWMPDIQNAGGATPVQYRFNSSQGMNGGNPLASKSAQNAAKMLLPQDPALASRMEKAIENLDGDKLRELNENWKSDLEKRLAAAQSEREAEKIRKEMEKQRQMEKMMQKPGNQENSSRRKENSRENQSGESQKSSGQPGDEKNQKNKENSKDPSQAPGDQDQGGKAKKAGKGAGNSPSDWKETKTAKPKGKLDFGKRDSGPALEWVNSGSGAAVPLSQILPGVSQSAEAAMDKENIPGDYEDLVGTYFQELSKEAGHKEQ